MTIAVFFRSDAVGAEPPKGQPYHVMYLEDGKMHVIDIFGTREKLQGVRRNPHAFSTSCIEADAPTIKPVENVYARIVCSASSPRQGRRSSA